MGDNVNSPSHYNVGNIEVIDAIDSWQLGFAEGNAVKYIARAKHKGKELEDLQKARWYLDHAIQKLEGAIPAVWRAELDAVSGSNEDTDLPLVWIVYEDGFADEARRIYCDWIDDEHSGPRINEAKAISLAQLSEPGKTLEIHGRPSR